MPILTMCRVGIFEIQVWLTGIAYGALIVSLYSFSLFLLVPQCCISFRISFLWQTYHRCRFAVLGRASTIAYRLRFAYLALENVQAFFCSSTICACHCFDSRGRFLRRPTEVARTIHSDALTIVRPFR